MESTVARLLVEGDRVLAPGRARAVVEAAGVQIQWIGESDLARIAVLMGRGEIDRVFLPADRLHPNGDIAAEAGSYALAVLSKFHGVPMFALIGEGDEDEIVPESLVTAWVRGHAIIPRTGSNRPT